MLQYTYHYQQQQEIQYMASGGVTVTVSFPQTKPDEYFSPYSGVGVVFFCFREFLNDFDVLAIYIFTCPY